MSYITIAREANTYNGDTAREQILNEKNSQFLSSFKSAPEYEQVKVGENDTVSSILYDCWIYSNSSYKEIIDMKTMIMAPNTPSGIVFPGQYIRPQRQGSIFIVFSDDQQYEDKIKGYIKECNFNLEYVNDVGKSLSLPCILDNKNLYSPSLQENKYTQLGDNKRIIIIQNNNETIKFKRDDEFLIGGLAYRITTLDRETNAGVCFMVMKEYQEGGLETPLVYSIDIQEQNLSFNIGQTKQLNVVIKENNITIQRPVVYESSDVAVAIVSDTGLVTGVANGNCIITAKLRDNESITDTVNIEITDTITDNIEYRFNPDNNVLFTYSFNEYSFNKYINDVIDNTATFTFEIDYNSNPNNIATLTIIDGNNCRVTANTSKIYGTIYLIANEGAIERGRIQIDVKSLIG